jgi:hypothetical protein
VLAATQTSTPVMPFQRGAKRMPVAFKPVAAKSAAIAAR